MDQDRDVAEPVNIATLPPELQVHIISYLNTCDLVRLRIVSRRFQSVCETPSLWKEFIWPHFYILEERCVENLLKSYGLYAKRLCFPKLCFPNHVPFMLTAILHHSCVNVVELSVPTSELSLDQIKIIMSMEKVQRMDILWTSEIHSLLVICRRLKELTVRIVKKWDQHHGLWPDDLWLDEWVNKGLQPQMLRIVVGRDIGLRDLSDPFMEFMEQWLELNPHLPTGHTGRLNIFSSLKIPMDLFPALPDFQLQFGQLCTLPFVKPSKCGLLGLEDNDILLTNSTYGGKLLHKARIIKISDDIGSNHFCCDNTGVFVTHFDASQCEVLHSGHLEQLAMACPNLQHLNIKGNLHCLEVLKGLCAVAVCCQNMQGLNLARIEAVESHVELWKILVDMKLAYLAIEICVLIPWKDDGQADTEIICLFQECVTLKALEVHDNKHCSTNRKESLSTLSKLPSLVHCFMQDIPYGIEAIITCCPHLKYFTHSSHSPQFSHLLSQNLELEQLRIETFDVAIPNIFLQLVSVYGRLVHVVLRTGILYDVGVTALIGNSPKLQMCHIYTSRIYSYEEHNFIRLTVLEVMLRKSFHKRKLFACGSFILANCRSSDEIQHNLLLEGCNTNIFSLWPQFY